MAVRWRSLFLLLIALLIAWASIWLNDAWISRQNSDATAIKESKVSHYFTHFSLTSSNAIGEVQYTLSGKHFSRWSGKDWSEISKPHLVSYSGNKQSTDMTADKAIMLHQKDILELHDAVTIKNLIAQPPTILTTELLNYYPEKQWLETDAKVTFTSDSSKLIGQGMDSKLDENILRIHSNVHSTFEIK